jgi:hypothetical protein
MEELLKDILAAQVITLAAQIKDRKAAGGTTTTSDCIDEAARVIRDKQAAALRALGFPQTQRQSQ